MRNVSLLAPLLLAFACIPQPESSAANSPATAAATATTKTGETSALLPAGPQSYTPETNPKGRVRATRQLWSARVGNTDYRTTMHFADGALYIGTKRGKTAPAGVYVLDGKTGARRALLPSGKGDVVGVAVFGDRVVSTSSLGDVVATTKAGKVLFTVAIGLPVTTPPTLVDLDADGDPEIVVGDSRGFVTALDGKTGKRRWTRATNVVGEARPSIGSGLAAADLDGDGKIEIVGGTESGRLFALRAGNGDLAWQDTHASALRAAPILCDLDSDGRPEVVAGWADGDVAIVDGKSGAELWTAHVESDDGDPTGLLATPTPIPGGTFLVPTARWGAEDSVVLLRAHDRAYKSKQGSVVGSPVLGALQAGSDLVEAVVGTLQGDVVSFDAAGGMSLVYHVDGAIEASPTIADLEGNGLEELVVVTRDGNVFALATHSAIPPVYGAARGSAKNDGLLPAIDLGWHLR